MEIHIHVNRGDLPLFIKVKETSTMGKQETVDAINAATATNAATAAVATKIAGETQGLLQKVTDLEIVIASQDSDAIPAEVTTAVNALTAQAAITRDAVTAVDSLVADATPPTV